MSVPYECVLYIMFTFSYYHWVDISAGGL